MDGGKVMLKKDTKGIQSSLVTYCKTGVITHIEGVNMERLPNYRRLVFNIVFDVMTNAFPIARQIFGSKWKGFLERFFQEHKCTHYQVWKLPEELLIYVQNNELPEKIDFPFLEDLLTFEWVEIVIYNEADKNIEKHSVQGDWLKDSLLLNPHHTTIELAYPIHKINAEKSLSHKGAYHVLVYRDLNNLEVRFMEISPFFKSMINLLETGINIESALHKTTGMFELTPSTHLQNKTREWLYSMIEKGFVLGYKD